MLSIEAGELPLAGACSGVLVAAGDAMGLDEGLILKAGAAVAETAGWVGRTAAEAVVGSAAGWVGAPWHETKSKGADATTRPNASLWNSTNRS